jgi:hypothetical protein
MLDALGRVAPPPPLDLYAMFVEERLEELAASLSKESRR